MNTNKNEEGSKVNKPLVLPNRQHYTRTVSAQPVLSETTSSTTNVSQTPSTTDKESSGGVKLNTNAPAFVPKEKRSTPADITSSTQVHKSENKENVTTTAPTTTTPTTTTTTAPVFNQPSSYGMGGYPMNIQGKYPQNPQSLIGYTYLTQQPNMAYPMTGQIGYSPNTRIQTGNFFPPMGTAPHMQPMGYTGYPTPQYQPKMPYQPVPTTTQMTPGTLPTTTPLTTTTMTPNLPLTNTSDKKIVFSKDSKVFIPKSMRGTTAPSTTTVNDGEGERKMSSTDVKETKEMPMSETITKEQEQNTNETKVTPITPTTVNEKEIVSTPTPVTQEKEKEQIQTITETQEKQVESKKSEKSSKLKDLLEAPAEKKPALAPKNTVPNKKVVVTTPSVNAKPLDKFEEKRKQLINQQKQEKFKPPVVQPIKRREPTPPRETYTPTQKEETLSKASSETPIPSDEEDETDNVVEEQKKNYKIERFYFLTEENKQLEKVKNVYSVDYILSFKNWRICDETKLLDDMLKDHIKNMGIFEDERPRSYKGDRKGGRGKDTNQDKSSSFMKGTVPTEKQQPIFSRNVIKMDQPVTVAGAGGLLGQWGRKDMSAIEKEAQEFRQKFDEVRKKDPLKNELTEHLNQLTVDNYEEVKRQIFDKIKSEVADQIKLLDVLFKKAVNERAFVTLYAKLCKDLDKDVPQKSEKDKRTSQMRSELLNKCREIFKVDNAKISQYINIDNEEEREGKLKKFLLGNVNFIGELINAKLLSKKIVFQCINNLFVRVEKQDEQNLIKQINLEAIVILMDKFGTLINKYDTKTKPEDLVEFNKKIDEYLNKLDSIQQSDKSLPGHVRYKIINLIEKRKRGWEESKVDKTTAAKGIKEVREEYESEQRLHAGRGGANKLDQDTVNARIKEDLYAFKSHIKDGYPAEEYHWDFVEILIKKHKNSLGEILTAFGENCIDFVNKQDDIHYAYLYFREIITFYSQKMDKKDRMELLDVTLYFLQNLSDFSLDNHLLVDVWGGVIYLLEFLNIFRFSDVDNLKDVQEDQLKTIFEVFNNALGYYDKKEDKLNEMNRINLVKVNKSLFQSIVAESSA